MGYNGTLIISACRGQRAAIRRKWSTDYISVPRSAGSNQKKMEHGLYQRAAVSGKQSEVNGTRIISACRGKRAAIRSKWNTDYISVPWSASSNQKKMEHGLYQRAAVSGKQSEVYGTRIISACRGQRAAIRSKWNTDAHGLDGFIRIILGFAPVFDRKVDRK